jgi:hypothetical protein
VNQKRRLSASIDEDLLATVEEAVRRGQVASVSAWANEAFRRQIEHESRQAAMADFLSHFEAQFGVITDAELVAATTRARATATVVRPPLPGTAIEPKKRRRSA